MSLHQNILFAVLRICLYVGLCVFMKSCISFGSNNTTEKHTQSRQWINGDHFLFTTCILFTISCILFTTHACKRFLDPAYIYSYFVWVSTSSLGTAWQLFTLRYAHIMLSTDIETVSHTQGKTKKTHPFGCSSVVLKPLFQINLFIIFPYEN